MDPVRAFAQWWTICEEMGIQLQGYIFRARRGYDQVSHDANDGMVSIFVHIVGSIMLILSSQVAGELLGLSS